MVPVSDEYEYEATPAPFEAPEIPVVTMEALNEELEEAGADVEITEEVVQEEPVAAIVVTILSDEDAEVPDVQAITQAVAEDVAVAAEIDLTEVAVEAKGDDGEAVEVEVIVETEAPVVAEIEYEETEDPVTLSSSTVVAPLLSLAAMTVGSVLF